MATEITMPKLSDTMTEGRLISWKKNIGDKVERGEIIAEVETDKATMELEAFASGILLEIRVQPGEMAVVGTVMGTIGVAGEKGAIPPPPVKPAEGAPAAPPPAATAPPAPTAPPAAPSPPNAAIESPAAQEPSPEPPEPNDQAVQSSELPKTEDDTGKASPSEPDAGEKASPLVRRLAREQGLDLREIKGSGPEGRIRQEDLEKAGTRDSGLRPQKGYGPEAGPGIGMDQKNVPDAETATAGDGAAQPLSRMRGAIARTVSEAWRTIPHFFVTVDIDMEEAERVRRELKGAGTPLSLNDFIIKAAAVAIGRFPRVNASLGADGITVHPDINIGIAVALEDGLLVPVIKGCGGQTLKEIAAASREFIGRAKAGKLGAADIAGGTFSISNLGMYGIDEFTAIIHPSQGAVLAVGAVKDRPVVRGGSLAAARLMRATLSSDHRLLDGAYAARFLRELKRVLENPVTMLV